MASPQDVSSVDQIEKNKQLWNACLRGDIEKARQYLSEGADMNWKGDGNKSSLDIAAYMNQKDIIDLLINKGVNVNEKDETLFTPLHSAAMFGNLLSMKTLVDAGADVNSETKNGVTPILYSANIGDINSIQYLISRGADWKVETKKDKVSPISVAQKEKHDQVVQYLNKLDGSNKILQKALSEGIVEVELTRLSIHGPPGSGKSCLQSLLLNKNPPHERRSTDLATRAMRAATTSTYATSQSDLILSEVNESDFLSVVAKGIKDKEEDYLHEPQAGWFSRLKDYVSRSSDARPSTDSQVSTAREILSLLPAENPSKKLFDARWVFSIDSGGQAAFQDIAPAFLRCNSINIITLRLCDKLDDFPSLDYVIDGKYIKSQRQNLSNLDIIVSFARSLSSLEPKRRDFLKIAKPRLLVVGTFSDKAKDCEETLEEKNWRLSIALGAYKDLCILAEDGGFIHPVNTLVSKEEGRERISAEWCNIIKMTKGTFEKVELPIRWFVFELELSKVADKNKCHVLSMEKCLEIGAKLGMDKVNVENAIKYLDALGLFLYFNILPHVVFVHPNSLLAMVSKLVSLTFNDPAALPQCFKLKIPSTATVLKKLQEGYLYPSIIEALCELKECDDTAVLSHDSFLALLEYLCIISKVMPENSLPTDSIYFMPCVLPWLPFTLDEERNYTKNVEPVILTWWNNKPFFYGLFPALVNGLLSSDYELAATDFKQRRNAIRITSKKYNGWILLVEDTCQLRIYYTGQPSDCMSILKMVEAQIQNVMHRLNYSTIYKKLFKAFYCENGHLTRVTDLHLKCDKCHCQEAIPLNQKQLPWLTDKQGAMSYSSITTECDMADFTQINNENFSTEDHTVRADYMTDILKALLRLHNWKLLGHELGFTQYHLSCIEKEFGVFEFEKCKKKLIWDWLSKCENCTKESLKCALQRMGTEFVTEYACPEVLVSSR